MRQIGLYLRIYIQPLAAFSRMIDEGRLIVALVAAVGALLAMQVPRNTYYSRVAEEAYTQYLQTKAAAQHTAQSKAAPAGQQPESANNDDDDDDDSDGPAFPQLGPPSVLDSIDRFLGRTPSEYFPPLIAVAVCFIPAGILVITCWDNLGGFATILFRDYLTLLMCCLVAWSAAYLPLAAINGVLMAAHLPAYDHAALWWAAQAYFFFLTVIAIRTLFGTKFSHAAGASAGAWAGAVGGVWVYSMFGSVTAYLASPFVLYYLYMGLSPDFRSLGLGLRSRQRLKQGLENATLNPRDADAHYQLGLIYQQRRQYGMAIERFQKAVSVDPSEPDAHYQLGRIAREQGRHEEALEHLNTAARLDDQHAASEVWREIGVVRLSAGTYEEARGALEKYLSRRPYDPEGNCWYGRALAKLGRREDAQAAFEQAIEAVRTMPPARKRQVRGWENEARREMKKVRG